MNNLGLRVWLMVAVVGLLVALGACKLPITYTFTYTFNDSHGYLVKPRKAGDMGVFAKKLEAWCSANGYVVAGAKDFPTFIKSADTITEATAAVVAQVQYLDPTKPTHGVLITLEKSPFPKDTSMNLRFYRARAGSEAETVKQVSEIKKLQEKLETAFPEIL